MYSKTLSVIAIVALMAAAGPAMAGTMSVVHPDNVLTSASTAVASTTQGTPMALLLDDESNDGLSGGEGSFYFGYHDESQRLSITDFTVPGGEFIAKIRLYSICNTRYDLDNGCRNLVRATIKSSTSVTSSLTASDYETVLATVYESPLCTFDTATVCGTIYAGTWNQDNGDAFVYFDIPVSAPAGTKSLYFDFGNCYLSSTRDSEGYPPGIRGYGERIFEVQALAEIPEPGTLALLATGLIGLLAYAWRKRK